MFKARVGLYGRRTLRWPEKVLPACLCLQPGATRTMATFALALPRPTLYTSTIYGARGTERQIKQSMRAFTAPAGPKGGPHKEEPKKDSREPNAAAQDQKKRPRHDKQQEAPELLAQKKEPKTSPKRIIQRAARDRYLNEQPKKVCMVYDVAERYDMAHAIRILENAGHKLGSASTGRANEVIHLLHFKPDAAVASSSASSESSSSSSSNPPKQQPGAQGTYGDLFILKSGVIISWGLPETTPKSISRLINPAAIDLKTDPETEDLEFIENEHATSSYMKADVIMLGMAQPDGEDQLHRPRDDIASSVTMAKLAFSAGLARTVKLAVLESSMTTYVKSTAHIPELLAKGKLLWKLSRRLMLRKLGELMVFRSQLNLYSEITDSLPDIFWDSRPELGLEKCYQSVSAQLDIDTRINQLNNKLSVANENAEILRGILSERHGWGLEWLIIFLIVVEVVFELIERVPVINHEFYSKIIRPLGLDKVDGDAYGTDLEHDIERARENIRAAAQSLERIFQSRDPQDPKQMRELALAMNRLKGPVGESHEITLTIRDLQNKLQNLADGK